MRTLMLGWEFPPHISGGLGTACLGLTRAMSRLGQPILFILPAASEGIVTPWWARRQFVPLPTEALGEAVQLKTVPGDYPNPYGSTAARPFSMPVAAAPAATEPPVMVPLVHILGTGAEGGYGGNLISKVQQFADRCVELTRREPFDVIHAHDWITFPAGIAVAVRSGKPLVVHVHATEFDRSGIHVNQAVYDVERRGMHCADAVIAVSQHTANILRQHYSVPERKTNVVHNGIDWEPAQPRPDRSTRRGPVVLFLGRLTQQKGPDYFVSAAEQVLKQLPDAKFIIAGWGDLGPHIVERVASMGLGTRILFAGFLSPSDVKRAFAMADVYVMPSVSEPFGLTALEAVRHGAPVILSRTSGAAEVLRHGAEKVDFWDTAAMAEKIVELLQTPQRAKKLCRVACEETRRLTWDVAARKCLHLYDRLATRAQST